MFVGLESHDRNAIKNNLQIIAKSAKLFNVPTVLSTVTAETFAGPFVPEVAEGVFAGPRGRRSHVHQRLAHSQFCEGRRSNASQAARHRRPLDEAPCAAFNVIEGLRRGYEVFFVADACGDAMRSVPTLRQLRSSALTQTEDTGIGSSFSKIALAEVVHVTPTALAMARPVQCVAWPGGSEQVGVAPL